MDPFLLKSLAMGVAGATIGAVVIPGIVTVSLGAMGFGAAGPAAGSMAAGIQASMGNVAGGSLFAAAQSAAMGGVPAIVTTVGAAIAGAGATIGAALL